MNELEIKMQSDPMDIVVLEGRVKLWGACMASKNEWEKHLLVDNIKSIFQNHFVSIYGKGSTVDMELSDFSFNKNTDVSKASQYNRKHLNNTKNLQINAGPA